jgi:hypothetical protein
MWVWVWVQEGKLRILVHDRSSRRLNPHQGLEDELVEVYLAFQKNRSFRGLTVKDFDGCFHWCMMI